MTSIQPIPPPPYQYKQSDVVAGLDKFMNHKEDLTPSERKSALGSVLDDASWSVQRETQKDAYRLAPPLPQFNRYDSARPPGTDYRPPGFNYPGPHESIARNRLHSTAGQTDKLFGDMLQFAKMVKVEFNGNLSVNQKEAFNEILGQYKAMKNIMYPAVSQDFTSHRSLETFDPRTATE